MKFLLTLLLFVVSCSTGLKPGADDDGGCDEGYGRNSDYNCVPACDSDADCPADLICSSTLDVCEPEDAP